MIFYLFNIDNIYLGLLTKAKFDKYPASQMLHLNLL